MEIMMDPADDKEVACIAEPQYVDPFANQTEKNM